VTAKLNRKTPNFRQRKFDHIPEIPRRQMTAQLQTEYRNQAIVLNGNAGRPTGFLFGDHCAAWQATNQSS
jgi:hypothetical protein